MKVCGEQRDRCSQSAIWEGVLYVKTVDISSGPKHYDVKQSISDNMQKWNWNVCFQKSKVLYKVTT